MTRHGWLVRAMAVVCALVACSVLALMPVGGVSATGRIFRSAAIGGEGTGFTMWLKTPLQAGSNSVTTIDFDPGSAGTRFLNGRLVNVVGTIEMRNGVERGTYPVLVASFIVTAHPPRPIPMSLDVREAD
jgi:hypothetical protein